MNRQCPKCGSVVVDGLNFCPSCGAPVVPEVVAPVVPEVPVIPTEPVAPVMPEPTVNVQQDVMGIPAVGPVPTMNPDAAPGTGVTVDSLLSTNAEVEAKKEAANAETNAGTNNDNPYTPGIGNIPSRSVMSA